MTLSNISAVVSDMDGVLWRGDVPLPGLVEFFELLRERNIPFMLATNNSSKAPTDYVAKLAKMGVANIAEGQIITSGTATAGYLRMTYPLHTVIHVLGGDGLRRVVGDAGFNLSDSEAQVVVVGIDPQLSYDKLKRAALLIRAGADFVGTNPDTSIPTPEGLAPGAGSILAALVAATERKPTIIGKPGRPMFEVALAALATAAETTLMIGDRLNTDIIGAAQVGMKTALVLTGVAEPGDVDDATVQPDFVFAGLPELVASWKTTVPPTS